MTSVYPENCVKKERKIKIFSRWIAAAAMLPMAYIWLPVSCCFVSPAIKHALPRVAEEMEHDTPMNKCIMNTLAGGVAGAAATLSCCCCFGCCLTKDPEEIL
jgi:amino acid permease